VIQPLTTSVFGLGMTIAAGTIAEVTGPRLGFGSVFPGGPVEPLGEGAGA
jgi:hypothetical protein